MFIGSDKMFIRDIRLLNIRVLNSNDDVLYEGMVENAPEDILHLNSIGEVIFDSGVMVLHV